MRAAVLHLAFHGLGAVEAHTGSAFEDNPASLGVGTLRSATNRTARTSISAKEARCGS